MSKFTRNVLLLAKLELTPGTDSLPTAGANAMLASTIGAQPVVAEFADRNTIRPYFGSGGKIQVSNYSEIEFEIEFASAGAAGTAPAYGPLLQACAFSETVTAGVDVVYAPVTNDPETVTIYYYLDGLWHKMTSCRGDFSIELNAKSIPVFKFKFTGLYTTVADAVLPAGTDYSGFLAPLAVNKVNTPTMTLHGVTAGDAAVENFSIAMNNEVKYRNLIGSEDVVMTDRAPSGQISMEMVSVATKAWHEAVRLGTLDALQMVHGSIAGQILQVDAPKVQLTSPQYAESDGIQMLNATLDLQPNTGNDEITITVA